MKPITLREIANACSGELRGDGDIKITSIVTDSRKAGDGALFCAIRGERVDGHSFIDAVASAGAAAVLCEEPPQADIPYILTSSTLTAIKGIAEYYRSLFTIPFIGITGSVGKTSTKEFIYSVLKEKYNTLKTQGNFNNELGVPLTLFSLEECHEVAVIEMGISDFSEMTRLSKMVRPDISVITNIGCCHLENLIDRDGVLKAKTEMFTYLKPDGAIILCGDDDKLSTVKEYNGIKPVFYGLDDKNEYTAKIISDDLLSGISCVLRHGEKEINVTVPSLGEHMVKNALCAMAVGEKLGLSDDEIKRGIESFENVGARSRVTDNGKYIVIDDSYNANPTSVKAGLDTLCGFSQRKVAVLGDMKELGKDEEELHFEVGRYAKDRGIDLLIAAGPLSKNTASGYGDGALYFPDTQSCKEAIKNHIHNGDVILVKASHSMRFEEIAKVLTEVEK